MDIASLVREIGTTSLAHTCDATTHKITTNPIPMKKDESGRYALSWFMMMKREEIVTFVSTCGLQRQSIKANQVQTLDFPGICASKTWGDDDVTASIELSIMVFSDSNSCEVDIDVDRSTIESATLLLFEDCLAIVFGCNGDINAVVEDKVKRLVIKDTWIYMSYISSYYSILMMPILISSPNSFSI